MLKNPLKNEYIVTNAPQRNALLQRQLEDALNTLSSTQILRETHKSLQ